MLTHPHECIRGASEVIVLYNGPLLSLLCVVQGSFPLLTGVVLSALLRKDSVSNFEVAMRYASVAGCVPGTIKLLHCGLTDRAKEGPGQRSILYSLPSCELSLGCPPGSDRGSWSCEASAILGGTR
jgi:hypothetical protein